MQEGKNAITNDGAEQAAEYEEPGEEATPEAEETEEEQEEQEGQSEKEGRDEGPMPRKEWNKLYRKFKDTERELRRYEADAEYWRNEAQRKSSIEDADTPVSGTGWNEPNPDNFDSDAEFQKAYAKYLFDQEKAQRQAEEEKQREQERRQKVDNEIQKALVKDPDFLDKAYVPQGLMPLIEDTDNITDIALYFGENRQEAIEMLSMSERAAARKLGKIEAKLEKQKVNPKTQTKAPPASKPVGGKETVAKSDEDLSTADFIAKRNKQEFGGGS